jgi:transposase
MEGVQRLAAQVRRGGTKESVMIYVGIDIAKIAHWVAAIDEQGRTVLKPVRFTQDAEGFRRLGELLSSLKQQDEVTIGFEATGHYWVLLAEELVRQGYTPQVFNPILSGEATRTTVRGRKTDADDALMIAKVIRDKHFVVVPLPTAAQAQAKRLARERQRTVARAANAKKRLGSRLDLVFPEYASLWGELCCGSSLALLAQWPSARLLASANASDLTKLLKKRSRGHLGSERARDLISAAKTSIAVAREDAATEMAIRLAAQEIVLLEEQVAAYDKVLKKLDLPGKANLQTLPGIASVLATIILAEIVTIERFTSKDPRRAQRRRSRGRNGVHRLLAYAGMDCRIRESGNWRGTDHMSKRGSRYLRTAIYQAAQVARHHEAFKDIWHQHYVVMKQPYKVALSHVARKLLQAIYGVLSRNVPFDAAAFKKAA